MQLVKRLQTGRSDCESKIQSNFGESHHMHGRNTCFVFHSINYKYRMRNIRRQSLSHNSIPYDMPLFGDYLPDRMELVRSSINRSVVIDDRVIRSFDLANTRYDIANKCYDERKLLTKRFTADILSDIGTPEMKHEMVSPRINRHTSAHDMISSEIMRYNQLRLAKEIRLQAFINKKHTEFCGIPDYLRTNNCIDEPKINANLSNALVRSPEQQLKKKNNPVLFSQNQNITAKSKSPKHMQMFSERSASHKSKTMENHSFYLTPNVSSSHELNKATFTGGWASHDQHQLHRKISSSETYSGTQQTDCIDHNSNQYCVPPFSKIFDNESLLLNNQESLNDCELKSNSSQKSDNNSIQKYPTTNDELFYHVKHKTNRAQNVTKNEVDMKEKQHFPFNSLENHETLSNDDKISSSTVAVIKNLNDDKMQSNEDFINLNNNPIMPLNNADENENTLPKVNSIELNNNNIIHGVDNNNAKVVKTASSRPLQDDGKTNKFYQDNNGQNVHPKTTLKTNKSANIGSQKMPDIASGNLSINIKNKNIERKEQFANDLSIKSSTNNKVSETKYILDNEKNEDNKLTTFNSLGSTTAERNKITKTTVPAMSFNNISGTDLNQLNATKQTSKSFNVTVQKNLAIANDQQNSKDDTRQEYPNRLKSTNVETNSKQKTLKDDNIDFEKNSNVIGNNDFFTQGFEKLPINNLHNEENFTWTSDDNRKNQDQSLLTKNISLELESEQNGDQTLNSINGAINVIHDVELKSDSDLDMFDNTSRMHTRNNFSNNKNIVLPLTSLPKNNTLIKPQEFINLNRSNHDDLNQSDTLLNTLPSTSTMLDIDLGEIDGSNFHKIDSLVNTVSISSSKIEIPSPSLSDHLIDKKQMDQL